MKITRRSALRMFSAAIAAAALPMRVAFAAGTGERRFVLIIQRGGMDGLAGVPPYGDPSYASARGGLAMPKPGEEGGVIALDGTFGLHPALAPLLPLWQSKELAVIHAVGLKGYDGRSHFDAQNLLETAAATPRSRDDGWLNRTLPGLANLRDDSALAVGESIPLVLQGKQKVASWTPQVLPAADEDYLARVARLYKDNPALSGALKSALDIQGVANSSDMAGDRSQRNFAELAKGAASIMKAPDGPRIAVIDISGWDTHADQGLAQGRLANALKQLADGVIALKTELGPIWSDTAIVIATEFGRTVAQNGSKGSDHGTGGVAFALGGTVNGGRVYGDWPGLALGQLNEARDLKITTDVNSVFKTALSDHMHFPKALIAASVFGSPAIPMKGLFRA